MSKTVGRRAKRREIWGPWDIISIISSAGGIPPAEVLK
jgi:hypothetical protein